MRIKLIYKEINKVIKDKQKNHSVLRILQINKAAREKIGNKRNKLVVIGKQL